MSEKKAMHRRSFIASGSAAGIACFGAQASGQDGIAKEKPAQDRIVRPASNRKILLSCKLSMIAKKDGQRDVGLVERMKMAGKAGFDGIDFDEAGKFSAQQARAAVQESGVFVHNAINHAHWKKRLTSSREQDRAAGRANIEHCIRLSHAAGGNGVLIVVGRSKDGTKEETWERARSEIQSMIPLAASLGQPILFENVWNRMMYDHDAEPEQSASEFVKFVDSFRSPWVGMYFDIGNHWKYGQPGDWIRAFEHRCVKLDVKGFSRAKNKFTDIGAGDLPWDQVRSALHDIGFTGWATAEVDGGGIERLIQVRKQMEVALGLNTGGND